MNRAKTALHEAHVALGAKLVPFAGWSMPVQYAGVLDEHKAVRHGAGLFDVSHMGNVVLQGRDVGKLLDRYTPWPMSSLQDGQAKYTVFLNSAGGTVDDLIVYRRGATDYLIIWNAANHQKNLEWIAPGCEEYDVDLTDLTATTALLALQGPTWKKVYDVLDLPAPEKRFRFLDVSWRGEYLTVARTGYTGEDGVEIWAPNAIAVQLWEQFLEAGAEPCGLGARDSLRIEAGLPLYGHELDEETDPFEAGIGFVVKSDQRPFRGREALEQRRNESSRGVLGFRLLERGVPREGYTLLNADEAVVGRVTSGTYSPETSAGIGLGMVDHPQRLVNTSGFIEIRTRRVPVRYQKPPLNEEQLPDGS